jgi:hypothetical protein
MSQDQDLKDKLLQIIQTVIQRDNEFREQYKVGEKFRFIRDRLQAVLSHAEANLALMQKNQTQKAGVLAEDDAVVYVYLFNAQGLLLPTWKKMLSSSVFYEHSVNRPVYIDASQVESFIRSKSNKAQHGYLSIAVKKSDMTPSSDHPPKDPIGNVLIKVREGSLKIDKVISFVHQGRHYYLDEHDELVEKKK